MRRSMVFFTIIAAVLALTGGTAWAAEIEVAPDTVPTPGETTLELTLSGFAPATTVFVVPCTVPPNGDLDDIDGSTCDLGAVVGSRTDADGGSRLTATWDIPDGGLAIIAGNEARTEAATTVVMVEETRVLGTAQDNPGDQLAETGSENLILAGIGVTLVAAGIVSHHAGLSVGTVLLARRRNR